MADLSPSKTIIGLYERHAQSWAKDRGAAFQKHWRERDWLDRLVGAVPVGGAILDLGCGSGDPIARNLISRGFAVTGVDSSPALIGMAAERLPNAEWIVGDMRALDLGRRFDALLAWHSFFHLNHDDQRAMFPRFASHAAIGARLMFTSGDMHGEAIGEWRGEPLYHASLDPAEYRELLARHGFDLLDHHIGDASRGEICVWLAAKRA